MFPNLIIAMRAAGMTQKQLAEKLNVAESTLSRKMTHLQDFSLTQAQQIAQLLEPHSMDHLFVKKD